ncbi:MAG: O-methyltransferase [Bacteroidota bacterium]
MNSITPEHIARYCEAHTTPAGEDLNAIERDTIDSVHGSGMISGHLQGRLLSMISRMLQPSCIVEIGTFTGYSALCLAEGLAPGGKLITIEKNADLEQQIRSNFSRSPLGGSIDLRIGDARLVLQEINEQPDLVFIDADKRGYPGYYEVAVKLIPAGGFIIVDNVLWKGRVTDPSPDARTQSIMEFNAMVAADTRVEHIMLPILDGLLLIRKK